MVIIRSNNSRLDRGTFPSQCLSKKPLIGSKKLLESEQSKQAIMSTCSEGWAKSLWHILIGQLMFRSQVWLYHCWISSKCALRTFDRLTSRMIHITWLRLLSVNSSRTWTRLHCPNISKKCLKSATRWSSSNKKWPRFYLTSYTKWLTSPRYKVLYLIRGPSPCSCLTVVTTCKETKRFSKD